MKGIVTYWQLEPHAYGLVRVRGKDIEIRHQGAVRKLPMSEIFVPSDTFRKPVEIGESVEIPVVLRRTLDATDRTKEMKVLEARIWIRTK